MLSCSAVMILQGDDYRETQRIVFKVTLIARIDIYNYLSCSHVLLQPFLSLLFFISCLFPMPSPLQRLYCHTHAVRRAQHNATTPENKERRMDLFYLLTLAPIRRIILDYVSAFDAAKLDSLLLCVLTRT